MSSKTQTPPGCGNVGQSRASRWFEDLALSVGIFSGVALAIFALPAQAQQSFTPQIGYVYPAGGRVGTSFRVTVGGQYLDGVTNACISGNRAHAIVLEHVKPLTPQQFNTLRDRFRELQEKRQAALRPRPKNNQGVSSTNAPWTFEDQKNFAEIRRKLASFQRRPANPAIAETVTLDVTIDAEAQAGEEELRLRTPNGLSNPLVFCFGQLPELSKREEKKEELNFRQLRFNNEPKATAPTETRVTLPATINGQIMPGGVDWYRFQARQGQQLVAAVSARSLIPYLADAVPGWFQATLALYDAKGNELTYEDDFRFHPDPVLHFEIPKDGEYLLAIQDAIYRGREDFVYRITVGEMPYLTGIFPLGGPAGSDAEIQLVGWNLPASTLKQTNLTPGITSILISRDGHASNRLPFFVDTLPECREREPNDSVTNAQEVALPMIVNGRIGQPGDLDVFGFDGHAGQEIVAEVYARRLESPLDSILRLFDSTGRQLAFNDDREDQGSGLNTHHADSWLRARLPAEGKYFIQIADAQKHGGDEYSYRLRLSAPRPDFELRITPSSIDARAGVSIPVTVYALRKDGFTDEILLNLKDAPAGFTLSGDRVPANQNQVRVTLSAPATPLETPSSLALEGRAVIEGVEVVRAAVPADDRMQAFAYHHLVPARELLVSVSGRGLPRAGLKLLEQTPVRIPAGGTVPVRIAVPSAAFVERFDLELSEPPAGITLKTVSSTERGAELVLQTERGKVKPGLKGNLIVNILPGRNSPAAAKGNRPAMQRRVLGSLPAIPFEIVEQ